MGNLRALRRERNRISGRPELNAILFQVRYSHIVRPLRVIWDMIHRFCGTRRLRVNPRSQAINPHANIRWDGQITCMSQFSFFYFNFFSLTLNIATILHPIKTNPKNGIQENKIKFAHLKWFTVNELV